MKCIYREIYRYMKGTQKRKYIHAVQLTTGNKSLSGAMCKSPPYWKPKIRGKERGSELPLFSHPFPEHLAMPLGTQRWEGIWARRWEIYVRFSLNSEWCHLALWKIPALNPRTAVHRKVLSIKIFQVISRKVSSFLEGWFLNVFLHYRS